MWVLDFGDGSVLLVVALVLVEVQEVVVYTQSRTAQHCPLLVHARLVDIVGLGVVLVQSADQVSF